MVDMYDNFIGKACTFFHKKECGSFSIGRAAEKMDNK
jgi:hypothetical protein